MRQNITIWYIFMAKIRYLNLKYGYTMFYKYINYPNIMLCDTFTF